MDALYVSAAYIRRQRARQHRNEVIMNWVLVVTVIGWVYTIFSI